MGTTVGIITLPGFNEIDSFVAARMIDSVAALSVELVGPAETAVSMAGITVHTPGDWSTMPDHAAVIIGSGNQTFDHIDNATMMQEIASNLDTAQLVGSQCSGAAILHRVGRLGAGPVCTDRMTAPKLEAVGLEVANQAFLASGTTASSGGCLSSAYLAYWIISSLVDRTAADQALAYVVPVGEEAAYQQRVDRLIPA